MELRTERLVLRPWQPADADRLFAIRRRPDVAQWLGDPTPWESIETAYAEIAEWNARAHPLGVWAIVPDGAAQPVGSASLSNLPGSVEVQAGWYLHPDETGNGYAAEAARGVLAHAFGAGVDRVWAIMWAHNEASAAVANAAGMDHLGVRHDPWYGTEDDPDSRMFRLDAPYDID